jgi:hypothetical protein
MNTNIFVWIAKSIIANIATINTITMATERRIGQDCPLKPGKNMKKQQRNGLRKKWVLLELNQAFPSGRAHQHLEPLVDVESLGLGVPPYPHPMERGIKIES